ncbi:MAG: hypothetical protein WA705_26545 [Candidatus Ozemobacteraceae bacterium]
MKEPTNNSSAGTIERIALPSPQQGGDPFAIPGIEHRLLGVDSGKIRDCIQGAAWFDLFMAYDLPRDGTVIEINPGKTLKIGHALAMRGFNGTLFVVEPVQIILTEHVDRYKKLLPHAEVIGVSKNLSRVVSDLPVNADALVSGQALEDEIIGKLMPENAQVSAFLDRYSPEGLEMIGRLWTHLEGNSPGIRKIQDEVAVEWKMLIELLDPRLVLICLDDSCTFTKNGLFALDTCLGEVLNRLRPVNCIPRSIEQRLLAGGQDPSRWLVERRKGLDMTTLTGRIPGAVERLGLSTFAVMDAYPVDPANAEVVYVQNDFLSIITGTLVSDDQAKAFVQQNLLLTLDPKEGIPGAKPIKVYVDRQADPMNISLVGNIGSGRAVYVGDRFNLKGIGKTVLATSKDVLRSNGVLDLVGSLWEMICSNVLQTNLRTGASLAFAVVDLKKDVSLPWYQDKVPSGMLIRLDPNGELDRPSHLFFREKPVTTEQMLYIAGSFGAQDAEKFIERILHGGWSAGNISVHGSLIDYDSVFALRGRAPQWSFRPNWISNFFGLEELGQKELLKALANHPINAGHVPLDTLFQTFDDARRTRLERRFPDLVGVAPDDVSALFPRHSSVLSALVKQFQILSMKMYLNFKATAAWDEDNATLSVYDVSRFFRLYPMAKKSGPVDEETALRLIRNPSGKMECSRETEEGGMPDSVMIRLSDEYGVASQEQLAGTDKLAMEFIKVYDEFLASIEKEFPGSSDSLCARAYVVNEERTYMNSRPGHDTLVALLQNYQSGKIKPQRFSEMLKLIIEACDRIPRQDSHGRFQADLRLSLDGYTSNLIGTDGYYQPRLTFPKIPMDSGVTEITGVNGQYVPDRRSERKPETEFQPGAGDWEAEIEGKRHPCSVEEEEHRFHVIGPRLPFSRLASGSTEARFFRGGEAVRLKPIARLDRPPAP